MKIGIFGGCFNPPHKMHEAIANGLLTKNYLDKVIYVPTGDFYEKKDLIRGIYRYEMLKLMVSDNDDIEVSDYEINNKKHTYETLSYFKTCYPNDDIYFICGSDNLKELDTWHEYKTILDKFKIMVISRGDDLMSEIVNKYSEYCDHIVVADIASSYISSSKIRDFFRMNNSGEVFKNLDSKVLNYINEIGLYKDLS